MLKRLAAVAICLAYPCGNAMAQDAKTVIANAQKALGDPKSITYSGSAKDVAFQQCGANSTAMSCQGTHDPMRPINNYVRVIDLAAPASRATGATNNIGPGGSTALTPGTFFQQVTPQQADVSQPWASSLEFYITPWGFLKGAAENNATVSGRKVKGHTVLMWSPAVKSPSGKSYFINGFVDENNLVDQVETWLGENIMGDMHIVATYTGWKDFGGVKAPSKIVQTRGGWPFFEVDVTAAKANPADVATLVPAPAPAAGRGGPGGGGRGPAPALVVTTEKLGDGLWKLTTGAGSYDSIIVEFKDYVMMLEAGQSEARGLAYVAEIKKLVPNKPIRYVWNSHPHSDHTGGLPVLVAEGATIVTQKNNETFLEKRARHAADADDRHAREEPEEGEGRNDRREEGVLGRDADRGVLPRLPGAALERPDVRLHPQGEGAVSGRLHGDAGRTGQRPRQGAGPGARKAQPRLRPLHPGARRGDAADEGGRDEGVGEIAPGNGGHGRRCLLSRDKSRLLQSTKAVAIRSAARRVILC